MLTLWICSLKQLQEAINLFGVPDFVGTKPVPNDPKLVMLNVRPALELGCVMLAWNY